MSVTAAAPDNLATSLSARVVPFATRGAAQDASTRFPRRPDLTVLSETIPLFYIGQNRHGFWVARESEGKSGGVFLLQRSALRFAKARSAPVGCATMFLHESFELDIESQSGPFVKPLAAAFEAMERRLPMVAAFIAMAIAEFRQLAAEIARAVAGARRNRTAIEQELFHGRYRLISKADDDLPLVS